MFKSIILIAFALILYSIGINAYQPSTLQLITFNSNFTSNIYLTIDLFSGKSSPSQNLIGGGSTVLGTLIPVDDSGNTLLIANVRSEVVTLNYNPSTLAVNQTAVINNFLPYEMTESQWGYDPNTKIAFHTTLTWTSNSGTPTYVGLLIANFATGTGNILNFGVEENITNANIVGTYNGDSNLYYAYYSDSSNTDHLIEYNIVNNVSYDSPLTGSTTQGPSIVEVFYYQSFVYIAKLSASGVTISSVDITGDWDTKIIYTNSNVYFTNYAIPFVFDENGFIVILNISEDETTLQPISFNLETQTIIEFSSSIPNQIPRNTWIINSIPLSD